MNRNLLKFFFITALSFPALGKQNSDDSKYIKLLSEGRIREYCAKNPEKHDSRFLARILWSASNEKKT